MQIELTEKPKNSILIEGFPGLGLVGTITTEFLIDHLKARRIGRIFSDSISPMVAVHDSKVVEPLGIFYDDKTNIVILHALINVNGLEWKIADAIEQLAKELKVKEIISIEGVGGMSDASAAMVIGQEGQQEEETKAYHFSDDTKKWEKAGSIQLKEGIVIGVTGALLLNLKEFPLSCVFAQTYSKLPDSRAAAKIVEILDNYLNLKIDYKPLLKKAEEFEGKVKKLLEQSQKTVDLKAKKEEDLNYLG